MIHGIDKQRFRFLLQSAIRLDDAKSFLKDQRLALVAAGAPLDNVPSDPQVIYRVIEGFGNRANQILGKWLLQRYKPKKPFAIPQLILRWRGAEELGMTYDAEEKSLLSQQGLCELFAPTPDATWLAFLRTSIPKLTSDRITIGADDWLALTTALLAKEKVAVEARGWPDAVVDIVSAVSRFDGSSLSPSGPYALVLSEIQSAIDSARPNVVTPTQTLPPELRRGIQSSGPELRSIDVGLDYAKYTVIATNRTPRDVDSFLLFVEGFVDDRGLVFRLNEDDMRKAIPTIGRIVLHPEQYDVPPQYGEPIAYEVQRIRTENKAKLKVTRRLYDVLLPVVSMPYNSVDAHLIRDYIADYAKQHLNSLAVFVCADKVCLIPRVSTLQKVLAQNFDWELDLWESLDAVEFQNGPYVLKLSLGSAQRSLNCAPLATVARKLLRTYTERSQAKLSKASKEQLIELIDQDDLRFDDATKMRLKANLEAISAGTEDYNELIGSLLQTQAVKEEIERRITAEVEVKVSERDRTRRELEQLRTQRAQLERRIADLSAEADSKAASVRAAVQRAFQHARENGIATLAEMALFDVLLNRENSVTHTEKVVIESVAPRAASDELRIGTLTASGKEVRDVFRRFGVEESLSDRLAAVLLLARVGGSPIVVTGTGASALGVELGRAISQSSCISVTLALGLIEDQHFETHFTASQADVLILRQANVSELSLCARSLLDEIVGRMMSHADLPPFAIVLIDAAGPAALPWPSEILESAVSIDLDAIAGKLELAPSAGYADQSWLRRRLLAHYTRLVEDLPSAPETLQDLYRLLVTCGPSN